MKIVIPGGTGQVGTILARSLHGAGHEVVAAAMLLGDLIKVYGAPSHVWARMASDIPHQDDMRGGNIMYIQQGLEVGTMNARASFTIDAPNVFDDYIIILAPQDEIDPEWVTWHGYDSFESYLVK